MKDKGLSAWQLKMIAVAAMLIDHIGWAFVNTASLGGQFLHVVGRLTAPIMCFFLAEGYFYTRNLKKYFLRLGAFACISAFAYNYYELAGRQGFAGFGMIYTLFLGLIAIAVWDRTFLPYGVKKAVICFLCILSLQGDWAVTAVLWPFYFARYRENPDKKWKTFLHIALIESTFFTILSVALTPEYWWAQIFQYGALLAIPLLQCYNGKLGRGKHSKWFFYIFYPVHLLILGLLKT